jgi:hypothetical protein
MYRRSLQELQPFEGNMIVTSTNHLARTPPCSHGAVSPWFWSLRDSWERLDPATRLQLIASQMNGSSSRRQMPSGSEQSRHTKSPRRRPRMRSRTRPWCYSRRSSGCRRRRGRRRWLAFVQFRARGDVKIAIKSSRNKHHAVGH